MLLVDGCFAAACKSQRCNVPSQLFIVVRFGFEESRGTFLCTAFLAWVDVQSFAFGLRKVFFDSAAQNMNGSPGPCVLKVASPLSNDDSNPNAQVRADLALKDRT